MLESQSWKSKIVTKMWRLKRWWYLPKLDYCHHKFDFGNFFSCPVKLYKNLKLKFRSKFIHDFTIIMAIYKVLFEKIYTILTLLTMGLLFGAADGLGGPKRFPSLKCLTYLTIITLGTVMHYPKKIQNMYKSRDTPLEFCWQYFFTENQQILLYQEIQI